MYSYAARFARLMESAGGLSPGKLLGLIFHLPNFVRLFWRLINDNRVPLHLRLICWGSIIYFFFPIDLLRDFPRLLTGRVDDAFFLIYAFRKLIKECPPEIVYEHVQAISERR